MTVEADLFAALKDLVQNRVFPDVAPFSTPRPYITYQGIGGQALHFVGGDAPDKRHNIFQINAWADSRVAALALARQIETALINAGAFLARPESEPIWSPPEPDLNRYGTIQDFSIWSAR